MCLEAVLVAASVQVLYMANEPNSIHIRAHRKERLRATAGHCGAKPSLAPAAPAAPAAIPESLAMQQNPSELLIASASFLTMSKVVSNTICRLKFLNSRRCLVQDQGFVPRAALPSIANGVSLVRYIHP